MLLRRTVLALVLAGFGLGFGLAPSRAAPAANAGAFLNTLVEQAVGLLRNKQLSPADREKQFAALLDEGFDIPRIARFVLGRSWTTASEAERQQFGKLFEQWIVHTYSARFTEYSGETVTVTGTRDENATSVVVSSQVTHPSGPPTKVDWRVRSENGDYKIVDVTVEGVSMALTQRDEFSSVIQQNGGTVAGLNKVLEQKLASGATGSIAK